MKIPIQSTSNQLRRAKSRLRCCLCWPHLVPFRVAKIAQVANLWKSRGTMVIELCRITWTNVQFSVQRQVVEFETDTVHVLSMIRSFKYSNVSVATREFLSIVHTCGERMKTEVVVLMNEKFAQCTVDTEPVLLYDQYTKHNIKYKPVVKIRSTRVDKLWSIDRI